ncbi:MAG: class I SAM-dependent methyltransferase [Nitrospinaceae bacterium]
MPTSTFAGLEDSAYFLDQIRPRSILDIGVGFGRTAFLAREYLDVTLRGRFRREDWITRIDGIEVFADYLQAHQRALYNQLYVGDAYDVLDGLENYDVVVLGDVLEHFEKPRAWEVLDKCAAHCERAIFLYIPLGERWTQGEAHGNPHERHLSFWERDEIEPFAQLCRYSTIEDLGHYGRFLIKKEDYLHHRVREQAGRLADLGRCQGALDYLENKLKGLPLDRHSEYYMVDMMIKNRLLEAAKTRLQTIESRFPDEKEQVRFYLRKLAKVIPARRSREISPHISAPGAVYGPQPLSRRAGTL